MKDISKLIVNSPNIIEEINKNKEKESLLIYLLINSEFSDKTIKDDEKLIIINILNNFDNDDFTEEELNLLISYLENKKIKLTELICKNLFAETIYRYSLFEINETNIVNYINKYITTSNNYEKRQLSLLLKDESEIAEYITKNITKYLNEVWMKEKREEDEKVTTELLLNDHVDRKLKFKIIENNLTKIEYGLERIFKYKNNNIGGYEEGIKFVKDLITQDKIIYTKENIIMLDDKMLIKYDKINSIKFNEIELREYKYYYKLINESKLSNKKLLDINVDTEEVSLTSINNDKFLKSFIETNNVDITTDVLKHTVNEKLYETYLYLLENHSNVINNITKDLIVSNKITEMIEILINNNSNQLIKEIITKFPEVIVENLDFTNEHVVENIIEYTKTTKTSNDLIMKLLDYKVDFQILTNHVRNGMINKNNYKDILKKLGKPYSDINEKSRRLDIIDIDKEFILNLKSRKLIWTRFYENDEEVIIRFPK